MPRLSDSDKKRLLHFARTTIINKLNKTRHPALPQKSPDTFNMNRGCFVTLHKRGALRGCIGTIEPTKPLVHCVEENALNAAFHDPRFPPLTENELNSVEIEISILSTPEKLIFKSEDELLSQIKPVRHGVILSDNWHRATFLPQVWEQLPDKRSFLEQLCLKAGLKAGCWQDETAEVAVYEVEYFSEDRV